MPRSELAVEGVDDVVVRMQERLPRAELDLGQADAGG